MVYLNRHVAVNLFNYRIKPENGQLACLSVFFFFLFFFCFFFLFCFFLGGGVGVRVGMLGQGAHWNMNLSA